jgi:hypothetical protein
MTADQLWQRATREAEELGPPPDDPTDRLTWIEERRGAVELLAALARHDASLLRQAATGGSGHDSQDARDLLLAAASM